MEFQIDNPELKAVTDLLKTRSLDLHLATILDKPEQVVAAAEEIASLVKQYIEIKARDVT